MSDFKKNNKTSSALQLTPKKIIDTALVAASSNPGKISNSFSHSFENQTEAE